MAVSRQCFPRNSRLIESRAFARVRRLGLRRRGRFATLFVLLDHGNGGAMRVGIVTSKRIGPAHCRNRWRRWVREIFRRDILPELNQSGECVVIVHQGEPKPTFQQLKEDLIATIQASLLRLASTPPGDRTNKPS